MGFVTPALLGGALLVAVPIVLHLIMRREAQRLKFPALRFVEQRRTLNQHRLRLRHLLLLALRCAIIAFLAFALARPTLRGLGAAGREGSPLAVALAFDDSLRMQYEQNDLTRFQKAKDLARWLIDQLPPECPLTVIDRSGRQRGQDLDRDAAELHVERLEMSPAVRPMGEAVNDAIRWLEAKQDVRGEIYVFTDMASEAWQQDSLTQLSKSLDELPGTNIYLIDVGADGSKNLGLGRLKLSSERIAPGGLLQINTDLQVTGGAGKQSEATVELFVDDGSERPDKRGQQVVALSRPSTSPGSNGERPAIEFSLSGMKLGTHQGFVRIVGRDGLAFDDVRYFTVEVRPPSQILLLAERPNDALFAREALAPSAAAGLVQSKFECDIRTFDKLAEVQLADYAAVCLLDPPSLAEKAWQSLVDFAEAGGGVGIFLGRHARRDEMNAAGAQSLLPGKLRWQSREATYLRPITVEHPAFRELGELAASAPWPEFPVLRFWELEAGAEPAQVVATFANGKPALVERQLGAGSVIVMTTSISDAASDDPWNLLPTGPEPWPFIALLNGIAQHLADTGQTKLNYLAGQTVVLPLSTDKQVSNYVLQLPDGNALRQTLTPEQPNFSITTTEALGNYRVRAGGERERLDLGFSINTPVEMSQLDRVAAADVIAALGRDRARLATNRDEIAVGIGIGRHGRELFPLLILAVALAMAAEQLLANRFYAGPSTAGSRLSASEASQKALSDFGRGGQSTANRSPSPIPVGSTDARS
jgi:hypothetical protein